MKKVLIIIVVAIIGAALYVASQQTAEPEVVVTETTPQVDETFVVSGERFWFNCADGTRVGIEYDETADKAQLAFRDELYPLTRTEAASGARYENTELGVEFWENQGEATVTTPVFDEPFVCQAS